ncbi:MAG: hypothetical protein EOO59_16025, partial [Hymenobacter sp.]
MAVRKLVWGCLLLFLAGKADRAAAQSRDKPVLLQGVGKLPLPREPDALGTTVTITEQPEIILTAEINPEDLSQSFQLIALASSRLGKGKVLAFSTPAYFRKPLVQDAEVQKLLTNCLNWGSRARQKRVQVWGGDEALTAFLTQRARVKLVGTAAALDPSADILLVASEVADTAQVSRLAQFVRRGGTLLYAPPPDAMRKQAQRLAETRFNELLRQAGLWQTNYLTVQYERPGFLSAGPVPPYLGMQQVLTSIRTNTYPSEPIKGGYIFAYTLNKALEVNPVNAPVIQRLKRAAHYQPDSLLVPTAARPVRQGKGGNYVAYLVQHQLRENQLRAAPDPAYVAPAAATFPGAVPASAARTT